MGFNVKADLAGCKRAFLVVDNKTTLSTTDLQAMSALRDIVKNVQPVKGFAAASTMLAELQKDPKTLHRNKFFKLLGNGEIVPAFASVVG